MLFAVGPSDMRHVELPLSMVPDSSSSAPPASDLGVALDSTSGRRGWSARRSPLLQSPPHLRCRASWKSLPNYMMASSST